MARSKPKSSKSKTPESIQLWDTLLLPNCTGLPSIIRDPQLEREAGGLISPEQARSFKKNLSDETVFNMIRDRHPDARAAWTVRYRPDSGNFHVTDKEWSEMEKRVDRESAKRASMTVPLRHRVNPPRTELGRAIWSALTKKPAASDREVCRMLDEDGIRSKWNESFEATFKDNAHRANIQSAISKVRSKMRKAGLLS